MGPLPAGRRALDAIDQGLRESGGAEFSKVLALLAQAYKSDRQRELARDRHHDAAARRAVELRDGKSRHADRSMELFGLRQRVLPLVGVEHQQDLVRRGRIDPSR